MKTQDEKAIQKVALSKNTVNYTGTVKIAIMKDKKVIAKRSFKNSGRWPLFKFICYCLNGDYAQADLARPHFIQFFYTAEEQIPTLESLSTNLGIYFNAENRKSLVMIPCMTNSQIVVDTELDSGVIDNIGSASITLKFMAPFSQIDITEGINMLGLYSNEHNRPGDPSAFIMIPDQEYPSKFGNLLSPAEIENANIDEYNLYVEWVLSIGNKGTGDNI